MQPPHYDGVISKWDIDIQDQQMTTALNAVRKASRRQRRQTEDTIANTWRVQWYWRLEQGSFVPFTSADSVTLEARYKAFRKRWFRMFSARERVTTRFGTIVVNHMRRCIEDHHQDMYVMKCIIVCSFFLHFQCRPLRRSVFKDVPRAAGTTPRARPGVADATPNNNNNTVTAGRYVRSDDPAFGRNSVYTESLNVTDILWRRTSVAEDIGVPSAPSPRTSDAAARAQNAAMEKRISRMSGYWKVSDDFECIIGAFEANTVFAGASCVTRAAEPHTWFSL